MLSAYCCSIVLQSIRACGIEFFKKGLVDFKIKKAKLKNQLRLLFFEIFGWC